MSAEAVAQLIAPAQVVKTKAVRTHAPVRERKMRIPQTIEEYETWSPKDGFKYEWKDGILLKLDKMDAKQHHIGDNLTRFFMTTKAFAAGDSLTLESKTKTTETRRRVPDIAYFTFEQRQTMYEGIHVTPYFAIEVISKGNTAIEMFGKLTEYFDTGVEVVWYIFPDDKTVYVFDSPMSYLICRKDMICSAEKVIAGFNMTVNEILKKPVRP